MSAEQRTVLFVCTGNSARSIMAEALMNDLSNGRFRAYSAGPRPVGAVHPLALETLKHFKIPSNGFRSKSWSEFVTTGAPRLDFVLTVCDKAAGEACPGWPGQPITAHWGVFDPATVRGSEETRANRRRGDLEASHPTHAVATRRESRRIVNAPPAPRYRSRGLRRLLPDCGPEPGGRP
jgi:arsenate reductase (thioredoxin)